MAYRRKPLYHFVDTTETGIDKIPLNRIIEVESSDYLYIKDNNIGLNATSTVQFAITNKNIKRLIYTGQEFDLYVDYNKGDIVTYNDTVYYAIQTPIGIPGVDNSWVAIESGFDFSMFMEDQELRYDASNMNDFYSLINTSIISNKLDASQAINTTDRQDHDWVSTVSEIYIDNKYVEVEVGDTITTDQGNIVVKEVHNDGTKEYDDIGYNGFGTFSSNIKFNHNSSFMWKQIGDTIYYKSDGGNNLGIPHQTGIIYSMTTNWEILLEDVKFFSDGNGIQSFFYVKKSNDTLYAIGKNTAGRLGIGNTVDQITWQSTGQTGVVKVSHNRNSSHTLILKNDGSVWSTGNNGSGQLGDGTTVNKNSFQSVALVNDAVDIITYGNSSAYVNSSNVLYTVGDNTNYQLGNGNNTNQSAWQNIANDALRLSTYLVALVSRTNIPTISYIDISNVLKEYQTHAPRGFIQVKTNVKKYIYGGHHPSSLDETSYLTLGTDNIVTLIKMRNNTLNAVTNYPGTMDDIGAQNVNIISAWPQSSIIGIKDNIVYQNIKIPSVVDSSLSDYKVDEYGFIQTKETIEGNAYWAKYWVIPEINLGSAPSTAYLNMHKAKSIKLSQDSTEGPWTALMDTESIINKVDIKDASKTQAVNKIYIDPANYEVRKYEQFCIQTGEIFTAKSVNLDASGYWIEPTYALSNVPTVVYGLLNVQLNNIKIKTNSVIIGGSNITQIFKNTFIPYMRSFNTKLKLTDDLIVTSLIGTLYKAF